MDFHEQAKQALRYAKLDKKVHLVKISFVILVVIGFTAFFASSNYSLRSQRNKLGKELETVKLETEKDLNYVSKKMSDTQNKLDAASKEVSLLTLQNDELMKVARKVKDIETQLNDAYLELDMLGLKVKSLAAENMAFKSMINSDTLISQTALSDY